MPVHQRSQEFPTPLAQSIPDSDTIVDSHFPAVQQVSSVPDSPGFDASSASSPQALIPSAPNTAGDDISWYMEGLRVVDAACAVVQRMLVDNEFAPPETTVTPSSLADDVDILARCLADREEEIERLRASNLAIKENIKRLVAEKLRTPSLNKDLPQLRVMVISDTQLGMEHDFNDSLHRLGTSTYGYEGQFTDAHQKTGRYAGSSGQMARETGSRTARALFEVRGDEKTVTFRVVEA
ncbi:hypothetical protein CYLTODRAFT_443362 [Cylindrobasidium torrendii FP15055 ss-10]|uniref:Uncharacterized protein n=1 Tax=Cylindrobasidium torrendii FP15055 ss-10 TaxID=1314674 RepID=A0A0D7BD10_9AGAR|nr:hypothetical protein CYLTODRAFT_443362 [Cylindrobasidium torrendii FP15055 ss-10]